MPAVRSESKTIAGRPPVPVAERGRAERWLPSLLGLLALLLLGALCWALLELPAQPATLPPLNLVEACTEPAVEQEYRRAALIVRVQRLPPAAACQWHPMRLPAMAPATTASYSVQRRDVAVQWIRVRYTVPTSAPAQPTTVFMPRLSGDGWMLWVDGEAVADNFGDWRMTWNRPLVVELPLQRARPGQTLELVLGLAYGTSSGFSLMPLQVGPTPDLLMQVVWRQTFQSTLPQICSAAQMLLGTFFLCFWIARRQEMPHLLLAASSIAWSISNLQYVMPRHDDPVLDRLYDGIVGQAMAWTMWLVYASVEQFDRRRLRWFGLALPGYVVAVTAAAGVAFALRVDISVGLQSTNSAVAVLVTAAIIHTARRGNAEIRAIAASLLVAMAAGIHDVALISNLVPPSHIYLLPPASLLVTGAFLFAVQRRYVRAIEGHERLAGTLQSRLEEQARELTETHERLHTLQRAHAIAAERERLMDDIHDGVGSSLVATIVALERQQFTTTDAAAAVRGCLDDLRLLIDSLEPVAGDVAALLANVRWRLEARLAAAGLRSIWQVDPLAPLPWLDAPSALQVLRLLQEAFANIFKHAGAHTVVIRATEDIENIAIVIEDDGDGFDLQQNSRGRGLPSMRSRAQRLGGTLLITSAVGRGTCWALRLPRQAAKRPQATATW